MVDSKKTWRAPLAVGIVLIALLIYETEYAPLVTLFVIPSGFLSGWLSGAWPSLTESGVTFIASGSRIEVTAACSGIVFFGLVLALGTLATSSGRRLLKILPLIYLFVVCTNALRILFWVGILPILGRTLPESFLNAGHEIAGALVYLPALFVAHIFLRRYLVGHFDDSATNHPATARSLTTRQNAP